MNLPVLIAALALAVPIYCAAKTASDLRAKRFGWAMAGAVLAVLAPSALAVMARASFLVTRSAGL